MYVNNSKGSHFRELGTGTFGAAPLVLEGCHDPDVCLPNELPNERRVAFSGPRLKFVMSDRVENSSTVKRGNFVLSAEIDEIAAFHGGQRLN